jgi:hypothetical protein
LSFILLIKVEKKLSIFLKKLIKIIPRLNNILIMSNLPLPSYIPIIQESIDKMNKNSFPINNDKKVEIFNKLVNNLYELIVFLDEYIDQRKNNSINQNSLIIYVRDFQPRMKKQLPNLGYIYSIGGIDNVNMRRIEALINDLDKLHMIRLENDFTTIDEN